MAADVTPGVHDSFWTHAGTVNEMSALLRKTFIDLHSRPLLKQLEAELSAQLMEASVTVAMTQQHVSTKPRGRPSGTGSDDKFRLPPMPPTGKLQLEDINRAEYFFS